jgi:RNA polymerase sigma-70 factor (TIGR02960 family)
MSHDQRRFTGETQRFRRELLAYCYRMVGSASEADDLVQETYLRAWRGYERFERRASMRSWLYRIASNVCLTALQTRRIRVLPSAIAAPYDGARPPDGVADDVRWLEPMPDAWMATDDPAATVIARESLRLALIASLQHFPARQRAVFILREILAFSADETAEVLDCTVAAVKSALQRVRTRLDELAPTRDVLLEPTDPRARELLDGYIAAFERSDASLLLRVLRADATLEATPFRDWQAGRTHCIELLARYVLGVPGDWRMVATTANGQPAAAVYRRGGDGALHPNGVVVLTATTTGVSHVVAFHHDPALVDQFR